MVLIIISNPKLLKSAKWEGQQLSEMGETFIIKKLIYMEYGVD